MLAKLKKKRPDALVTCDDMTAFKAEEKLDYIFITSGSVSLFTAWMKGRNMIFQIISSSFPSRWQAAGRSK